MKKPLCSFAAGAIGLLIMGGLIIPLMLGMVFKLHYLPTLIADGPLDPHYVLLLGGLSALAPFIFFGFYALRMREERKGQWIFLVVLLGFAFVARLVFVFAVESQFDSDFRTMWDFAVSVVQGERPAIATSIPEVRTLPYLLPVTWLAGGSSLGYQIANAIAGVVSALLVYGWARNIAGQRAGILALSLIVLAPEPWFATEIPTHNIPGTLFLLGSLTAYIWAVKWWQDPWKHAAWTIGALVATGILAGLADLQRSTGLFIYAGTSAAFVLMMCNGWLGVQRKTGWILTVVLFILLPYACGSLLADVLQKHYTNEAMLTEVRNISVWGWIGSYAGPDSVGDYRESKEVMPYISVIPLSERRDFAIGKVMSEYHHDPVGLLKHYVRKAMRLFHLGRQGGEYYGNLVTSGLVATTERAQALRQVLDAYNSVYALVLASLAVVCLIAAVWWLPPAPGIWIPMLVLATMAASLIIFGEIQSSYMFPAWFILPFYIGVVVARGRQGLATPGVGIRRMFQMVIPGVLGVLLISAGLLALRHFYGHESGRMFLSTEYALGEGIVAENKFGILVDKQKAGDSVRILSIPVQLETARNYFFELFVSRKELKPGNNNCAGWIELRADGEMIEHTDFEGTEKPIHIRIGKVKGRGEWVTIDVLIGASKGVVKPELEACSKLNIAFSRLAPMRM